MESAKICFICAEFVTGMLKPPRFDKILVTVIKTTAVPGSYKIVRCKRLHFMRLKHGAADFGPPPKDMALSKRSVLYGQPLLITSVPSLMPVMTLMIISF